MSVPVQFPKNDVNVGNYIALAMRTNSTVVGQTYIPHDVLHAALGLADEYFEFKIAANDDERIEEITDTFWFIALACHGMKLTQTQVDFIYAPLKNEELFSVESVEYELGEFIGPIKKWYTYGAVRDGQWATIQLRRIFVAYQAVLLETRNKKSTVELMQLNIDKLRARFPDKFTVEHALNRDTDAEYAAVGLTKSLEKKD